MDLDPTNPLRSRRLPPDLSGQHILEASLADESRRREAIEDVPRIPEPAGGPPVPGAQWDEVHGRWERWDADTEQWVVVGDPGDGVDPAAENPLPAHLARELHHADEVDAANPDVDDVRRAPEPPAHLKGAQWNEVQARWEKWDDAKGAWLPAE